MSEPRPEPARAPESDASTPERDLPPGMREQLHLGHAGLATFANRPWLTEPEQLDSWQPDVAIVGAPFDISTTNRPGARFGPRAIRASAYMPGTYHLDLGIEIFDWLEVVDFGDAHCPHGQTEVGHANIRARVGEVARRGIVPIVVGGDHSITWPAATAVAEARGWGNVGIVHFDAHADTADVVDGNMASHGTPMRRLIESGAVLGRNFVQVGLRGYWPPEDVFEWMQAQGMRWHLMQEIWERGVHAVIDDAVAEALDGTEHLYVSVDIDVLDPAFAPGTGTPSQVAWRRRTCCAPCAGWPWRRTWWRWTWSRSRRRTTCPTTRSTTPIGSCSRHSPAWPGASGKPAAADSLAYREAAAPSPQLPGDSRSAGYPSSLKLDGP